MTGDPTAEPALGPPPGAVPSSLSWLATCPRGVAPMLADELLELGAAEATARENRVDFVGPAAVMYRACLWSRLANRILMPLGEVRADDTDALYNGVRQLPWRELIKPGATLAIDFHGTSPTLRDTRFGAQRCKDAIVDWFVSEGLPRPSVDRRQPDFRLQVRLSGNRAEVAIDLSGGSLHRRGYRTGAGQAPLKENLAAAILRRADWPGMASRGGALIDPMCGAGTLLIEGAMMVADIAPALGREQFGFGGWAGHNETQWRAILADARGRAERGRARQLPEIRGYDDDPKVVRKAQANVAALGLEKTVRITCKSLSEIKKPTHIPLPTGLIVSNPPYGERLGSRDSAALLYQRLGELLDAEFQGWQAALLAGDISHGRALGLRSHRQYQFYNGALPVTLLLISLENNRLARRSAVPEAGPAPVAGAALSERAQMLCNRLRKNQRKLASWLRREQVEAYRLYDADMPEYAFAIDVYGDWLHVAEYAPPESIDPAAAAERREEALAALAEATGVPPERIVLKQRERQRGSAQYRKRARDNEYLTISEGRARLQVNLSDYLDTGLFLDHRPLRLRIAEEAKDRDFLNLFCYTGAATVQAALGGANSTTSVDLSRTYLDWLRRNLALNGLGEGRNHLVQASCLDWLSQCSRQYDLVFLDPPSFSNSKRMQETFDVQRDQVALLEAAMAVLRPGGWLYFSTNRRKFRLDETLSARYQCTDITRETLGPDFSRGRPIHQCWRFSAPE